MNRQEKKYRIKSFTEILKLLKETGAKKVKETTTTHYYGEHTGNDVEKFVEYDDRCEIHILKETQGRFVLTKREKISNKSEGLQWLKDHGYSICNIVKMTYSEYKYKSGMIGLYVVEDFIYSVILYYPLTQHEEMEKVFGLTETEVIEVPYNKYLDMLGRLRKKILD